MALERSIAVTRNTKKLERKDIFFSNALDSAKSELTEDICINLYNKYKLCGKEILDPFFHLFGFENTIDMVPKVVSKVISFVVRKDINGLQLYFNQWFNPISDEGTSNNYFLEQVITRLEIVHGFTDQSGCDFIQQEDELWTQKRYGLFSECRLLKRKMSYIQNQIDEDTLSINPISLNKIRTNLIRYPKLKMYVYSAENDIFCPPSTFKNLITTLSDKIIYKEQKEAYHDGFLRSDFLQTLADTSAP